MADCIDCLHFDICQLNEREQAIINLKSSYRDISNDIADGCRFFKNKADFVEVKHGEWHNIYMSSPSSFVGTCSECKRSSDIPPPEQAHYCPRCGADMKEEGADSGKVY